jgi:preprotein translocase subunit Sss1
MQASRAGSFKGSALGQALELELAIEQAIQFEKKVEMLFFQANKMDVWLKIKARAAAMEKAYADQQRLDKAKAARKKQEIQEAIEMVLILALAVAVIGFVGYSVYEILAHCKSKSCGY